MRREYTADDVLRIRAASERMIPYPTRHSGLWSPAQDAAYDRYVGDVSRLREEWALTMIQAGISPGDAELIAEKSHARDMF